MDCFYAAIHAGADAVYLGGMQFGARAYATNFSNEDLLFVISYAHLFGRKIYLTLNTLVKEKEFSNLHDFVKPLYEAGLDGVIIQDFGVLSYLKQAFPGLPLHASTQMCVSSSQSAALLKSYGVCRVVPARELSLDEMVAIKEEAGVEVESFIHGAMCYCYSGQCLFSSFLGGRSGNRGRCAGPCRLPYNQEAYPLSLKDMCTLPVLDKLLDAGIDSFKIEGRMKNPYYVAGVTSIYRKYMDLYYENQKAGAKFSVDSKDLEYLKKLYIRTDLETGYYFRHNGAEMITMHKPGYNDVDESDFLKIKEHYLDCHPKIEIEGFFEAHAGDVMTLTVSCGDDNHKVFGYASSDLIVEHAQKKATTQDEVLEKLKKTGNTEFAFSQLLITMDEELFLPIKAINELRRQAIDSLRTQLLQDAMPYAVDVKDVDQIGLSDSAGFCNDGFSVVLSNVDQLRGFANFAKLHPDVMSEIRRIILKYTVFQELTPDTLFAILKGVQPSDKCMDLFMLMPSVGRRKTIALSKQLVLTWADYVDGYYIQNLDHLWMLKTMDLDEDVTFVAGPMLYHYNKAAASFLHLYGIDELQMPYELNMHEWRDVCKFSSECLIYGRIPFMQATNCIKKTYGKCDGKPSLRYIEDRYGKKLPVVTDCSICENTIYNSVPLSLHDYVEAFSGCMKQILFTIEEQNEVKSILEAYLCGASMPFDDYTKGHFKKGVL